MTKPFPTLSGTGWLTEPVEIGDRMLSYFFISDGSQSQVFSGNVSSLPSIIQKFGNNPTELVSETQRQLENMFNRQFNNAVVKADVDSTAQTDNRMNLRVSITYVSDGKTYNLGRMITILDSAVLKIAEINNDAST